jgi:LmbE family N-acetylglucosaminyl deacetylase
VFEQDQRRERDNVKAVNDQLIQQRRQEIRDAAEALGLKITETTK